ncbi:SDR family oxidoreductase [Deinococcus apachensis]|uniref:SDR family oxidoreductase n=1 Tax=Deinococcus apachensis TaxID=309886 RepID=UPI00037A6D45|nr:SDR family oxidoreductase [Deinococcus apachensis]
MIIVTGANGKLGRATVERLLERLPADQIGVSVRDPERARDLQRRGVRVRQGDFNEAAGLAHAFEGASRVLLVSSNTGGEGTVRQHQTAIDAAGAAGAGHIFYTSHAGADLISAFPPARSHAATEVALRDSGLAYTSLRNGYYAQTAVMLVQGALRTGELRAPQDGPINYTAHPDLAEATAIALTDGGEGDTILTLTGPEAMDTAGLAALASELTGRRIRRVVVPDDEFRAGLVAQGVPGPRAALLLGMFVAARQGAFTRVDPTLARLIGRPPTSVREVLKAAISPAG